MQNMYYEKNVSDKMTMHCLTNNYVNVTYFYVQKLKILTV